MHPAKTQGTVIVLYGKRRHRLGARIGMLEILQHKCQLLVLFIRKHVVDDINYRQSSIDRAGQIVQIIYFRNIRNGDNPDLLEHLPDIKLNGEQIKFRLRRKPDIIIDQIRVYTRNPLCCGIGLYTQVAPCICGESQLAFQRDCTPIFIFCKFSL